MRFIIAKPEDKMSMGDLFYSVPAKEEKVKAFDELVQICLRRADREFPRCPDYTERNGMIPQVEKELGMIQDCGYAIDFLVMHEIALLSRELGYPTAMFGMEGGLIISYLLGISNIHPAQTGYSTTTSDIAIETAWSDCSFDCNYSEQQKLYTCTKEILKYRIAGMQMIEIQIGQTLCSPEALKTPLKNQVR